LYKQPQETLRVWLWAGWKQSYLKSPPGFAG